jgi:HPt (histidine-containing phosphotransfer) domain-containing protein
LKITSSSGNVGAIKLVELCKEIERKARENNLDDTLSAAAAIDAEYKRVHVALEKELKKRLNKERDERKGNSSLFLDA